MKRRLSRLIALLFVVGISALALFMILRREESNRAPIEDMAIVYIDGAQIVKKALLNQYITESNRRLLATMAASQLDDEKLAESLTAAITNLDNTGLALNRPIYAYLNGDLEQSFEFVTIVEVLDAAKVDDMVKALSQLAEQDGALPIHLWHEGENRTFELDGIYCGYNSSRFAVVIYENMDGKELMNKALSRPLTDLSRFSGDDIATYLDANKLIAITKLSMEREIEMLRIKAEESEYDFEREMYDEQIASLESNLQQLATTMPTLGEKASITSSLRFEAGEIELRTKAHDIEMQNDIIKRVSDDHLNYIEDSTIAVINYAIDGAALSKAINDKLPEQLSSMLGISRNEFNMGLQIALDAISSINGDVTLSLGALDGKEKSRYNPYTRGYDRQVSLDGGKVLVMADVKDDYIISNIATFAGGMLTPEAEGMYSVELSSDMRIDLGQQHNTLFFGLNTPYCMATHPATSARWHKAVAESYGYMLIDIENMMQSSYIAAHYAIAMEELDEEGKEIADALVEASDYIYTRLNSHSDAELILVFDNKEKNALATIAEVVMPYIMRSIN